MAVTMTRPGTGARTGDGKVWRRWAWDYDVSAGNRFSVDASFIARSRALPFWRDVRKCPEMAGLRKSGKRFHPDFRPSWGVSRFERCGKRFDLPGTRMRSLQPGNAFGQVQQHSCQNQPPFRISGNRGVCRPVWETQTIGPLHLVFLKSDSGKGYSQHSIAQDCRGFHVGSRTVSGGSPVRAAR